MGTTVNDVYTPLFDDNVNISFHVFVKKAIRTFDPFFSTTGMRAFDEVDYDALNTHFLPKDGQLESEPTLVTEESTHAREHVRDHAKVRERFRSRRRRADGIPRREEPAGLGRQHKSCMHLTANQRAINALRFRIEEFINLLMYYMFDALVVKNRRL